MEKWYQWIKQIVFCLVFLELLVQMVQGKEYQKYLKFVGGLILILTAAGPLMQLLQLTEGVEEKMFQWNVREEAFQVQEAGKELAQLQNRQIEKAYKQEVEKEITAIVNAYGTKVQKLNIIFEDAGEEQYVPERVQIEVEDLSEKDEIIRMMEICLGIEKNKIIIKENNEDSK